MLRRISALKLGYKVPVLPIITRFQGFVRSRQTKYQAFHPARVLHHERDRTNGLRLRKFVLYPRALSGHNRNECCFLKVGIREHGSVQSIAVRRNLGLQRLGRLIHVRFPVRKDRCISVELGGLLFASKLERVSDSKVQKSSRRRRRGGRGAGGGRAARRRGRAPGGRGRARGGR